ncbi:MAG: hypothetical protein M0C28_10700 [Candidatus Moduliflexus flocculans]|nr:hypothetical protein [Candidatus Moduliflexus flocculans]
MRFKQNFLNSMKVGKFRRKDWGENLMLNKKYFIIMMMISILFLFCTAVMVSAQMTDTDDPADDEQDTFLSVSPDALIVLDLSGSMAWNPAEGDNEYGSSNSLHTGHNKMFRLWLLWRILLQFENQLLSQLQSRGNCEEGPFQRFG